MSRFRRHDADAPGHDSFLDIVANMVGILIILVMVVAVRVKNAPVAAISGHESPLAAGLRDDLKTEQAVRAEVLDAERQIRRIEQESLVQRRSRDALLLLVSAAEHEIQSRRDEMDAESREAFDLGREVAAARAEAARVERQRAEAEDAPPETIVVESYPTPLSKTVNDTEFHFQLMGGRIVPIPLEELVEELQKSVQRQKYKLLSQPELTDTVGPLGGFRLRYTMESHDVSPETAVMTGQGGRYAALRRWTLIPVSSRLGEPVEQALAEGSEFRRAIARLRPGESTITIWTYQDSFAAFRTLKRDLYQQGFAVAARPLPLGTPISGSPEGSKSAAE